MLCLVQTQVYVRRRVVCGALYVLCATPAAAAAGCRLPAAGAPPPRAERLPRAERPLSNTATPVYDCTLLVTRLMCTSDVLVPINRYENTVIVMKGCVDKVTK